MKTSHSQHQKETFNDGVRVPLTGGRITWRCDYRFNEDLYLATERVQIHKVSIVMNENAYRRNIVLDMRLGIRNMCDHVLRNAVLRLAIQDSFGKIMTSGQIRLDEEIRDLEPGSTQYIYISKSIHQSLLGFQSQSNPFRLLLILEDGTGAILDVTAGEFIINEIDQTSQDEFGESICNTQSFIGPSVH